MPAIRIHDPVFDDMDDDDGMPPLVDNPNPSMNFTFFTDMRPITYSPADNTRFEVLSDTFTISSTPSSPELPESLAAFPEGPRTSHGKKRDASYIPRPPNAFILFRSSFIRSQQVPGKVEGNHSTLSKIIGMYWKTLPREEREVWEAKALVAQAEHRKRYPDWRFRPGANAMAKLKIKDGPGTSRKKSSHRKDKGEEDGKGKSMEKRCAKIADLLVEGKKGMDLEAAVKEWEGDRRNEKEKGVGGKKGAEKRKNTTEDGQKGQNYGGRKDEELEKAQGKEKNAATNRTNQNTGETVASAALDDYDEVEARKTRCKTPDAVFDSRFKVPLTAMFKRSLSAPASHARCSPPPSSPDESFTTTTTPSVCCSPYTGYSSPFAQDDEPRVNRDTTDPTDCASPLVFTHSPFTHWDDPFASFDKPMTFVSDTDMPGFEYGLTSPAASPLEVNSMNAGFTTPVLDASFPRACKPDTIVLQAAQQSQPTSYSTLKGWAGDTSDAGVTMMSPSWPMTAYDDSFLNLTALQDLQQSSAGLETYDVLALRDEDGFSGGDFSPLAFSSNVASREGFI